VIRVLAVALVVAVVHVLMARVAVLPGVAVPVAFPVLAAVVAVLAVLTRSAIRAGRRSRSSPCWRSAAVPGAPR
jgi:membrane protein implicated in regulation of membrane protease activity